MRPTFVLEDAKRGVKIAVDHMGIAAVYTFHNGGWVEFYRLMFNDLARGHISTPTIGRSPTDVVPMLRAVAMASEHVVRQQYAELIEGGW